VRVLRVAPIGILAAIACGGLLPSGVSAEPAQVQHPSIRFVDVSSARGFGSYRNENGQGSGLAAADFDDDGDVDIFVPQAAGRRDLLFVNDGHGFFTEASTPHGLARMGSSRTALWFDCDNDGDLDLLVASDDESSPSAFYLYRQDPGHVFTDVTAASGMMKPATIVLSPLRWGGICAGDIDNDGDLDVYSAQWGGPCYLFLNHGDGTFTDIGESSGVSADWPERHQPIMYDFDGDGWTDIFVAVDFNPNELWINQHDHTFVNVAAEVGLANNMNDMGVTLGDYDNDGDFDIYITNVYVNGKYNVLHRNDSSPGNLLFTEVAREMGVDDGRFGWGATWLDVDNDGDVDLATNNGYFVPQWAADTSKFFWNVDAGRSPFIEEGQIIGYGDDDWGSALAAVDFDMDGDLDLLQTCMQSSLTSGRLTLFDNQPGAPVAGNHWLIVRPRIDGPNRYAIGAVVRARGGDLRMMRLISAGTSYLTQEPAEAFFGAGGETQLDLTIEWPDGVVSELDAVPVDQVLTITRPAPPVVAVTPGFMSFERVQLTWQISGAANRAVTVERRRSGGAWEPIADVTTDALGTCTFEDGTVAPGEAYAYRIEFRIQGTPFVMGEVSVQVPEAFLSLTGAVPNPSPSGLHARFALHDASPATLTLYDLSGRLRSRVEVGPLGAGRHTVDLAAGLDLEAGLYWIRLEQAGSVLTRRAALVP